MVPVGIALAGAGLDRATVAFIGWFGPRGLASVVFALIAFDSLDPPDGNRVLAVVTATVVLSVVAHGISAAPIAAQYGQRAAALQSDLPEHAAAPALRTRSMAGDRARSRATLQ
jgi:NhaP-type Na+/H+ or K+/H+ antiporter